MSWLHGPNFRGMKYYLIFMYVNACAYIWRYSWSLEDNLKCTSGILSPLRADLSLARCSLSKLDWLSSESQNPLDSSSWHCDDFCMDSGTELAFDHIWVFLFVRQAVFCSPATMLFTFKGPQLSVPEVLGHLLLVSFIITSWGRWSERGRLCLKLSNTISFQLF